MVSIHAMGRGHLSRSCGLSDWLTGVNGAQGIQQACAHTHTHTHTHLVACHVTGFAAQVPLSLDPSLLVIIHTHAPCFHYRLPLALPSPLLHIPPTHFLKSSMVNPPDLHLQQSSRPLRPTTAAPSRGSSQPLKFTRAASFKES